MGAHRFFVEGVRKPGDRVAVEGSDAHKILRVLRLRSGDEIEAIDSAGVTFSAALDIEGSHVHATLIAAIATAQRDAFEVDVAQAVPKGQKMDFVVEKATELGARAILPFYCERSVVHDAAESKVERWRRLAKAAAMQCGRRDVPPIETPLAFEGLLERFGGYDAVLFSWELAPRVPLREQLPGMLRDASGILVVVGAEGGFTHDEAEAARAAGAGLVWLGSRILRAETAALVVLSILNYAAR